MPAAVAQGLISQQELAQYEQQNGQQGFEGRMGGMRTPTQGPSEIPRQWDGSDLSGQAYDQMLGMAPPQMSSGYASPPPMEYAQMQQGPAQNAAPWIGGAAGLAQGFAAPAAQGPEVQKQINAMQQYASQDPKFAADYERMIQQMEASRAMPSQAMTAMQGGAAPYAGRPAVNEAFADQYRGPQNAMAALGGGEGPRDYQGPVSEAMAGAMRRPETLPAQASAQAFQATGRAPGAAPAAGTDRAGVRPDDRAAGFTPMGGLERDGDREREPGPQGNAYGYFKGDGDRAMPTMPARPAAPAQRPTWAGARPIQQARPVPQARPEARRPPMGQPRPQMPRQAFQPRQQIAPRPMQPRPAQPPQRPAGGVGTMAGMLTGR